MVNSGSQITNLTLFFRFDSYPIDQVEKRSKMVEKFEIFIFSRIYIHLQYIFYGQFGDADHESDVTFSIRPDSDRPGRKKNVREWSKCSKCQFYEPYFRNTCFMVNTGAQIRNPTLLVRFDSSSIDQVENGQNFRNSSLAQVAKPSLLNRQAAITKYLQLSIHSFVFGICLVCIMLVSTMHRTGYGYAGPGNAHIALLIIR